MWTSTRLRNATICKNYGEINNLYYKPQWFGSQRWRSSIDVQTICIVLYKLFNILCDEKGNKVQNLGVFYPSWLYLKEKFQVKQLRVVFIMQFLIVQKEQLLFGEGRGQNLTFQGREFKTFCSEFYLFHYCDRQEAKIGIIKI